MENYIYRMANSKDIDDLIELLNQLFTIEEDFRPDNEKQKIGLNLMLNNNEKSYIIVCEYNSKIIGMVTAQMVITTAEGGYAALIEDMVVDKNYRGKGIGKTLLNKIENWANSKGAKRLQLVADKNNLPAIEFYKHQKWNETNLVRMHKF